MNEAIKKLYFKTSCDNKETETTYEKCSAFLMGLMGEPVNSVSLTSERPEQVSECVLLRSVNDEEAIELRSAFDEIFQDQGWTALESYLEEVPGDEIYTRMDSAEDLQKKRSRMIVLPFLVYRDGIVCELSESKWTDNEWYVWVERIYYTVSSAGNAKDLYVRLNNFLAELFRGKSGAQENAFPLSIMMATPTGTLYTDTKEIKATSEISNPDFMINYNADFPIDTVNEFLGTDKGGIMIFNGESGTGKSTFLKYLISKNRDTKFVVVNQKYLYDVDKFKGYLFSTDGDEVYIVEDCERLLIDRDHATDSTSSVISDVLNYTDGLLGDMTRSKFIFTFNTQIQNIDSALLRKGRLWLQYEFGRLKGENLERLAGKLGYRLTEEERFNGVVLTNLYNENDRLESPETLIYEKS